MFRPIATLFFTTLILNQVQSEKKTPIVVDIIKKNGYPVEQHVNIQTGDGYLLDMQRIPYGKKNATQNGRPPVLLMHGLMSSAESWVVTGEDKSLAFILADSGYDVWLGNARGTTHSRKHVNLDPNISKKYWEFSWHEIGVYDLPAKIDHILRITQQEKLFYVGHSQGTTSFFVMASVRPKYNEKIRLMTALAPVAFMGHINNPFFRALSLMEGQAKFVTGAIGVNEFMSNTLNDELISMASNALCKEQSLSHPACTIGLLIAGFDPTHLNESALPSYAQGSPAGASTYQLSHYAQLLNSGTFSYYDYGLFDNMRIYHSIFPPQYKLSRVTSPVALYYSKNDNLVAIEDVKSLEKRLPNVVKSYLIPYKEFNHIDFIWAKFVVEMLYDKVIDEMNKF